MSKKNLITEFRADLIKMESQFKACLPSHVTPEKFIRVTMTAIQNSPDLLNCDRGSLFSSALKCASDGLIPDGREAAFVKFKTKTGDRVQYLPMIYGIVKRVRNSGELASIMAQVVYKNDKFKYWVDTDGEHLEHEPLLFGNRGERIGVYALAKTKDGAVYIEPMPVEQVMAVKNVSKAKDTGAWSGAFEEEMWRKTALKRLSKKLPMNSDVENLLKHDEDLYDFKKEDKEVKSDLDELKESLSIEGPEDASFDPSFDQSVVAEDDPKMVK